MKSLVQRCVPAVRLSRGKLSTTTGQWEKRRSTWLPRVHRRPPAATGPRVATAKLKTNETRVFGSMKSMKNNSATCRELQSCLLFVRYLTKHAFQKKKNQPIVYLEPIANSKRTRRQPQISRKTADQRREISMCLLKSICAARPRTPRLNSWNVKSIR